MMLQPIDAAEYRIAFGQRSFQRNDVPGQRTTLFVNARLESTMPSRQFEQLRIHSALSR